MQTLSTSVMLMKQLQQRGSGWQPLHFRAKAVKLLHSLAVESSELCMVLVDSQGTRSPTVVLISLARQVKVEAFQVLASSLHDSGNLQVLLQLGHSAAPNDKKSIFCVLWGGLRPGGDPAA